MLTTRVYHVSAGIPEDISDFVLESVEKCAGAGICTVCVNHDCAALISCCEDAPMDADLMADMERAFPARGSYSSAGDIELTAARVRCAVLGTALSFPVRDGRPLLGPHQRIRIASPIECRDVPVSIVILQA